MERGGQLCEEDVQRIVREAAERAGLQRNVSPNTLRRSFATHLLEQGTEMEVIQEILGTNGKTKHSASFLRKVVSPLDN